MSAEHLHDTVTGFIAALAARESVPGGGSAAALEGALASALHLMVLNYSDKTMEPALRDSAIRTQSSILSDMERAVDEDVVAFKALLNAISSKEGLQEGYRAACDVPLGVARGCLDGLELLERTERSGYNRRLVTDLGGAAYAFRSAARSALLNARVNLKNIDDACYRDEVGVELERIASEVERIAGGLACRVERETA